MGPKVTFVVPCYNLAHLLPECINSILVQSFKDFEIIIMDDCSPDATPEVAKFFHDPRIIYIRNENNLKHLANYNKGISLARGKYVWLISADDCLRKTYVLEQYIKQMEDHPEVGFVFCAAFGFMDGKETDFLEYSFHGDRNRIFHGRHFLKKLLEANGVVAASAMARKECYEKVGYFPLDMPYAGDWYLWCMFSLYYDVAYLSEPMVYYRQHNLSMTNILKIKNEKMLFEDDIKVLSRVKENAKIKKLYLLASKCNRCLALRYVNYFVSHEAISAHNTLIEDLWRNSSLLEKNVSQDDLRIIRAGIYAGIADWLYSMGETSQARKCYMHAVKTHPGYLKAWLKYIFLLAGKPGKNLRYMLSSTISKCLV